jgi:hypothetical protein
VSPPTDLRLAALGATTTDPSDQEWVALDLVSGDTDTAASLVFKHPLVVSLNPRGAAITLGLIYSLTSLAALADQIAVLRSKGGYRTDVPVVIAGQPAQFPPTGWSPPPPTKGQPAVVVPPTVQPRTAVLDPSLTPLIAACIAEAVSRVNSSSALAELGDGSPADRVEELPAPGEPATRARGSSGVVAGLSGQCVDGSEHGVRIEVVDAASEESGEAPSVRLKVTNDYARFVSVYAQFFDAGGRQVFVTPRNIGDTTYASIQALVMPVLTEAGVPVPGSSTREFDLELPDGASTARLLTIGLGNARYDTPDWSTYFVDESGSQPYSTLISPPEALLPVLLTAVVNFGFTAAMLVLDALIANGYGDVVSSLKELEDADGDGDEWQVLSRWTQESTEIMESIEKVEGVASPLGRLMALMLGTLDVTTEMEAEGTDQPSFLESAWGVVEAMGIAFSEFIGMTFLQKIVTLLVEANAEKAEEALPIVGEIFAVAAALIDAANLAEAAYATASAPWVMATEVTFTYDMDVVVTPDPRAGSLPQQARTFRMTAQVRPDPSSPGGAGTASSRSVPVEGTVSDHVVENNLAVTISGVPLGGQVSVATALWSGSTPGTGWQAAGGASAWYPNNDIDELPAPTFPLVQNVVPIDSSSTLVIYNTTEFEAGDDVYDPFQFQATPQPNDWTAAKLAQQRPPYMTEVGSITFSAPSNGVAYTYAALGPGGAPAWYLRSYALMPPASPDITTVPTVRWAGPYAQRPWILYDPLEQDPANGQHFILEPSSPGYQVRKVSLVGDLPVPTGIPFDIDGTMSWGRFLVDLDDAAIHHLGWIVGVTSATGTLSILRLPATGAATAAAPKARGYAGPAMASDAPPGMLADPTHVAVTMDGVVLVLESGANRLQAFSLAGRPVNHFPATSTFPKGSPYAALPSTGRTYLALSTDGGGAIYVLSVPSSSTAAVKDYRLEVLGPDGTLVYTSQSINVGDLAVDYFRNVHGLNFAPLIDADLDTQAIIDKDVPTLEPSVSSWYTSAPGADQPPETPALPISPTTTTTTSATTTTTSTTTTVPSSTTTTSPATTTTTPSGG